MEIRYLKTSRLRLQRVCFYGSLLVSLFPKLLEAHLLRTQSLPAAGPDSATWVYLLHVATIALCMAALYVGVKSFTLPKVQARIRFESDPDGKRYFRYTILRMLAMILAPLLSIALVCMGAETASYLGLMSAVMLLFVYPTQNRYLQESGQEAELESQENRNEQKEEEA